MLMKRLSSMMASQLRYPWLYSILQMHKPQNTKEHQQMGDEHSKSNSHLLARLQACFLGCLALPCLVSQLSSLLLLHHQLAGVESSIHSRFFKFLGCKGCLCSC